MIGFYDQQHEFYGGVDLHTRKMHLNSLDRVVTNRRSVTPARYTSI